MMSIKNKKVLVMGLGRLGGGVATVRWLVKQGARVTVTDIQTKAQLALSIKALGTVPTLRSGQAAKKVRFMLGGHREEDFRAHDVVVVNPGVPKESPYLKIAKAAGARIINDAVLFFDFLPKENPIIAVTGTRGKTTTTYWIAHLLRSQWPQAGAAGNTPENPLLKELDRVRKHSGTPAVLELSSWQLEPLPESSRGPDVAVITNLYRDHMNRYASMEEYARAKANIFKNQTKEQTLILPYHNAWTRFFLRLTPRAKVLFYATRPLPSSKNGIFLKGNEIVFRRGVHTEVVVAENYFMLYAAPLGAHNIENLLAAMLAAHVQGVAWEKMRAAMKALPQAKYREEIVYAHGGVTVVNDAAATSPEAAMAALRRFSALALEKRLPLFFITGGTDKKLEYKELARELRETAQRFAEEKAGFRLCLLEGSGTVKLFKHLNIERKKDLNISIFKDLKGIVRSIGKISRGVIVFSPGAASFEKFQNEFDRGAQFNVLVKKSF